MFIIILDAVGTGMVPYNSDHICVYYYFRRCWYRYGTLITVATFVFIIILDAVGTGMVPYNSGHICVYYYFRRCWYRYGTL